MGQFMNIFHNFQKQAFFIVEFSSVGQVLFTNSNAFNSSVISG